MTYRHTKVLDQISTLLPSTHPDDELQKAGAEGKAISINEGNTFFSIAVNKPPLVMKVIEEKCMKSKGKGAETNERNKMLRLIIGMAIEAYGYDPKNTGRQNATGENNGSIKARLQLKGITIDNSTIKKYLDEAKELL